MEDIQIIHSYTRKEALADGVLVDQSELGRFVGFTVPLAVTAQVIAIASSHEAKIEEWPKQWFIRKALLIARLQASYPRNKNAREFFFEVPFNKDNEERLTELLRCDLGSDDDGKPCITIMMHWED